MTGFICDLSALRKGMSSHDPTRFRQIAFLNALWPLTVTIGFLSAICAPSYVSAASLEEVAERYRPYLLENIGQTLTHARSLQERAAQKDITGAKQAWISARAGWERVEVFTGGFAPDFEEKIDAWPDAISGFHAIETKLFGVNRADVEMDAGILVGHLAALQTKAREVKLTPQGLLNGTTQLAYEVGDNKSDGGESRVSNTSLDDMRNNVAGIQFAYNTVFSSAIEATDPALASAVRNEVDQLKTLLDVPRLNKVDKAKLRQVTEQLAVSLQSVATKIGLAPPALETNP
jgi:iron uptake system component EfeO